MNSTGQNINQIGSKLDSARDLKTNLFPEEKES